MKNSMKRTAAVALAGVMAAGMLAGCGKAEAKLDGSKTVATVNKTEVPMGLVSLYARIQQAQTDAMYKSFMGTGANMWDTPVEEGSEETYGDQMVSDSMKAVELMLVLKEKAADYGVEVTDEDQTKIADAAAAFMEANGEEVITDLAVTEDQIKTLLELQTYRARIYDPIVAEADIEITDEEANQSAFSYVSVSTSSEELTEEDKAKKKEQAQEILDKMKEDPTADMSEVAKSVDESYTALNGTFTTTAGDDVEDSYPEEVMTVLRTLKEAQLCDEVIETENGYYIVRLDAELDEEATASKKSSLEDTRKNEYYQETVDKWLEEADVTEDEKVLDTLKITNAHTFTIKMPEAPAAEDTETVDETTDEGIEDTTAADEAEVADDTETTDDAETEEPTDAAADDTEADGTEEAELEETDTATVGGADDTEVETTSEE